LSTKSFEKYTIIQKFTHQILANILRVIWINAAKYANFTKLQHDFIADKYYIVQAGKIKNIGLDVENYSNALKNIVWSVAVHHGPNSSVIEKSLKKKT
jgi:hypothetical protein